MPSLRSLIGGVLLATTAGAASAQSAPATPGQTTGTFVTTVCSQVLGSCVRTTTVVVCIGQVCNVVSQTTEELPFTNLWTKEK